ncbi:MAG: helix-turn-helix domain-containing protein [Pseudomonadota bacterium]|nr:helix-turn-helix domain-containing protein [Pseudomonadota bacterium]
MLTQKQNPEPLSYRVNDAARALGVSRRTVERWIEGGTLRATKVGRMTLIPAASVRAVVDGGE